MSTPYSPENQQPYQPQQGGSPQQGGYPQGDFGQQPTQQMPAVGGYGQQPTQQMPAVGGYGQQAQQGYYAQGQFQGAPDGGQPAKKKTGLIIGIIAAVLVVLIAAGVAIWWFVYNDDSSDDAAAQSTPSTAAPSAGVNPSQPPVAPSPSAPGGTKPSQPTASTSPSAPGGGSESDKEKQAIAECTKEINNDYTNANVSDAKLELKESYGETRWWDYTGTVTGTSTLTNKPITTRFTCSVFYFEDEKDFSAVVIPENY